MNRKAPTLAIPLGDPAGIGPEVCLRFARSLPERDARYVFVGDPAVWAAHVGQLGGPMLPVVTDLPARSSERALLLAHHPLATLPAPGVVDAGAGAACHAWVARSVALAQAGQVAGIVTPPIHKEAWHRAGIAHAGHTEALRAWAGVERALMFFVGAGLRIALASVHVPLRRVADLLTTEGLLRDLRLLHSEAQRWFGLSDPRIAVCGINPHAGEGGLLGSEDDAIVAPAVAAARSLGLTVQGPLPADACIPAAHAGRYDLVLAMYHDQALPAIKALAPRACVNVTLGLPFVRTSVDHGTAFDIAGQGIADDTSLRAAVDLALDMVAATDKAES